MTIEIFAFPPSARAFKALVVANYLAIDYTLHVLDPREGDFQKPEYAAINPNRHMPKTLAQQKA
ncbi:MAG: hypothetical protein EXR08_07585 [Alphaproteobacteria bacterium]|nr:hypothetical protein [Alphaproteobacteria bacterium]